jgi:hypothetical protein
MKPYALILFVFLFSCTTLPVSPPDVRLLRRFFERCASDLEKAKRVIIDRDLIKNLTHLQLMDNGGRRYYLLERENITALIRSVTEGAYSDFIIINKSGTVVYSMRNNDLFAGNVLANFKHTVLDACYEHRAISPYIGRASRLPGDNAYTIPVSAKVTGEGTMPGIFVLVIKISKINNIIGKGSFIVDSEGDYAVTRDHSKINTRFEGFDRIDVAVLSNKALLRITGPTGGTGWCQPLRYSNLNWIIITE